MFNNKKFVTILQGIDPKDGQLKMRYLQIIEAKNVVEVKRICKKNGLGYLRVAGQFIGEIK
jgi:hypothetical protein